MKKTIMKISMYFLFIAVWQAAASLKFMPDYLFPSPLGVFQTVLNGFGDGSMVIGIAVSMRRIFIGYAISLAIGIITGMALGSFRKLDEIIGPFLLGTRSLPSICWLPLGIMWIGLNEHTITFVVVMGAAFSISLATRDGIRNIPSLYLRAASTMGISGTRRYTSLIFPAALPSIVIGMKLGWAFAWRSLMAGEMLFVSLGLGHLLMMGRELNDINRIVSVMILIIIIGNMIDSLIFSRMEKSIRTKWGISEI